MNIYPKELDFDNPLAVNSLNSKERGYAVTKERIEKDNSTRCAVYPKELWDYL